ncbi:ribosomal protein S18-alanine N-acetyltransferase [Proteiniborus sp. MB09-C3]|uniref:ribosomal protein S18-alanine N-acetyltransferase n=1 Tax=Proteiniborus sp. MB09-C3 TaxID=3050072 RepID=UPI002556C20A|nr:ribosomal protein S18-alanine N-acetyltransferase [Proteiniborus sp. MB09-C3]WIV12003.1 ribosomal protein S18-alanine N-acetyltransferase [Proteiniborus sp. MB09-C3]
MSNVIVREMAEKDIDEVIEIEKEAFETPWSREAFVLELIKNQLARYVVAEKDGKIAGYGGLWLILDEGHITNIAVSSAYRGQGIGNMIVEKLIDICEEREIKNMTLEVRKSNLIAQSLYKKYDFIDCGVRKGYYTDTKEDAVIMWRVK